jgi:hypothetical protein
MEVSYLNRSGVVESIGTGVCLEANNVLASYDRGRLGLGAVVHGTFVATKIIAVQESSIFPRGVQEVVVLAGILVLGGHLAIDNKVRKEVVRNGTGGHKSRQAKNREVLHRGSVRVSMRVE